MKTSRQIPKAQSGVALIEAMISILLFAIAILGLIALQMNAVRFSTDAKYRSVASLLIDQMISEMRVADPLLLAGYALTDTGATSSAASTAWANKVKASLPGVHAASAGDQSTLPTIRVVETTNTALNSTVRQVIITVFWALPGQTTDAHQHQISAFIGAT
ncbi:MAG: type IV pilus modification protein PilV [Pseudomonadota bacterium]